MINVNQITAQLAKLPDQSLQRYAMMHKDDPYIVSLALAESNRRKEIRGGAQMNAAPQPKVAEQAIQGMASVDPMGNYVGTPLPENVGIGQLPAKNIAKMAGGGIVAFGGGGEVPRYNGATSSSVSVADIDKWWIKTYGMPLEEFVKLSSDQQTALRAAAAQTAQTAQPTQAARPATPSVAPQLMGPPPELVGPQFRAPSMLERGIGAINRAAGTVGEYAGKGLGALSKAALPFMAFENFYGLNPIEKQTAARMSQREDLEKAMSSPSPRSPTAEELDVITSGGGPLQTQQAGQTGAASTTGAPGPDGKPTAPTQQDRMTELREQLKTVMGTSGSAAAPSVAGLPGLKPMTAAEAKATAATLVDASPVLKQFDEFKNQVVTDLTAREQQFYKEQAELPKYGVKAEEQLKKREAELAEDKKAAGWMAVIETGLGWMSSTSPFLLANLGAGGQKGMASYKDSMKDFKKLQSEYDKMRLDIERAQVAEARDDFKTRNDFRDKADQRRDNINKLGIQITSDIFQTNSKVAGEIWTNGMREYGATARTIYQEQGQTNRANAGLQQAAGLKLLELAQPSATEKLYTTLGGGDPVKGLNVYASAMGYGDKTSANLLKQYTGIAGEQQLRALEESPNPQDRLRGAQISQKIKDLQGIGGITALDTPTGSVRP